MSDVEAKMNLRDYLNANGWVAYPREMMFGLFCDVAGFREGKFYAFEIKQKGDVISKALKQLKDYSRGVHYCIVVADKITEKMSKRFEDRGYGVWIRDGNGYIESAEPVYSEPREDISYIASKFKRECGKRFENLYIPSFEDGIAEALDIIFDMNQRTIEDFL